MGDAQSRAVPLRVPRQDGADQSKTRTTLEKAARMPTRLREPAVPEGVRRAAEGLQESAVDLP